MEGFASNVVHVGGLELKFHVDETNGAGELVMFEMRIPTGARVPAPHHHEAVDEAVFGLEGSLRTTVDGRVHDVGPGDVVFIARGSVHQHENVGADDARALVVLTPGKIGRRYFEEIGAVVNGPERPDPERIEQIMLRHGLVPAARA